MNRTNLGVLEFLASAREYGIEVKAISLHRGKIEEILIDAECDHPPAVGFDTSIDGTEPPEDGMDTMRIGGDAQCRSLRGKVKRLSEKILQNLRNPVGRVNKRSR
jgi:hypothetical protein